MSAVVSEPALVGASVSPFPYQLAAIRRLVEILEVYEAAADLSSVGVGKTYVALFVAMALGLRPFVLCPKSVIPSWEEASRLVGVELLNVTNYEKIRTGKTSHFKWTYGKRVGEWHLPSDALLVFDEAHRCKNRKSQSAKLLIAAKRCEAKSLILSATLAESPLDMYAVGLALDLFNSDGYWSWAVANGVRKGRFSYEYHGGQTGMARIRSTFGHRSVRITPNEVPGFPDNIVNAMEIETGQSAAIEGHWAKLQELKLMDEALPIVEQLRLRQEIELLKIKALAEMSKDAVAEGCSVVIFLNFTASIEAILQLLTSLEARGLTGNTPSPSRQEIIDSFQRNEIKVLVSQARCGGEGISLHDVNGRPRVSLLNPSYSATELLQCLGRIHRQGSKSPAVQRICFAAGSQVESRIRAQVQAKLHNLESLNDGDLI